MAERAVAAPSKNRSGTLARVLTAAVLIPLVVGAVLWGPTSLVALLVAVVLLFALIEFFHLSRVSGQGGYDRWTTFCALVLVYQQWVATGIETRILGSEMLTIRQARAVFAVPLELVLVGFVIGAAAIAIAGKAPLEKTLPALGASAAGLLLVGLPMSYAVRLHGTGDSGPRLLLFTLVLVWVGDTLAYFIGRWIGRLKMAPRLSPKKTWEGAAANVVGALMVAGLFAPWVGLPAWQLAMVAVLANVAGQVGDLVESALKRGAGMKDSGGLLPGHGGMLDRVDSLLFALPVVWGYAWWLGRM